MDEKSLKDDSRQSLDRLIPIAYEELRRVARQRVAQLTPGASWSATDLVNETLLRLLKRSKRDYNGADHLIRTAAMAMHDALVDRARRKNAAKRSGALMKVDLADELPVVDPASDMLAFNEACEVVRQHSEEHYELLLMRVYVGLSTDEIAARRGQSKRTVERQWKFVRALIATHIAPEGRRRSRKSPSRS